MLPWLKGLDTDTDPGVAQFLKKADYLTFAEDIVYDVDASKVKRGGFIHHDSAAITGTPEIKGGYDYWANVSSVKSQKIVVWDGQSTSKCWVQPGAGGSWTELTKKVDITYPTLAPTNLKRVCFEVFNDDLIMAITDSAIGGRLPLKWDNQTGTEYETLGGYPPKCKFLRKHQGRLWMAGDPTRPDRLHFSSPGNAEEWNGEGDSGAIDIDPGDGDPEGITAIFPSFRGILFVAKGNAIYKVTGTTPDNYKVEIITSGVGCISHNSAVAIDMDDIYFASERGFHSLVLTDKYGDFEGAFLSKDVQKQYLLADRIFSKYIQGVWVPSLNSVVWNMSRLGTRFDHFWLYDVRFKAWYKWTGANPTALFRVEDVSSKVKKAYFGDEVGRMSRTDNELIYHDYTNTAIESEIETPYIYPDNDAVTEKGFKKIGVWLKMPEGDELTVTAYIAGLENNTIQTLTYSSVASNAPQLDVDFILGESELDADGVLKMTPYTLPVDGYGTSIKLRFENDTVDGYCAIFGFWIEWEGAGDSQETRGAG